LIFERLLFFIALLSPTALALWRSGFPAGEAVGPLAWAMLAAAIPSVLPRRLFLVSRLLVVISIPAFLWWIGYVALNGVGPGWDAAIAAVTTNTGEASSAARLVIATPGFVLTTTGFLFLLAAGFAARYWPSIGKLSPPAEAKLRNVLLAASMLPLSASAFFENTHTFPAYTFGTSDPYFSPIGTLFVLAQTAAHRAALGELLESPQARQWPVAKRQLTDPELAIFVIGESMRAGGISPAQASRGPWTRELVARIGAGLGAWAPATCVGSHGTHVSVPLLLTGLPPRRFPESATAPSVLAKLKAAGFSTAWISNQDPNVFQEGGHNFYWYGESIPNSLDENVALVAASFAAPLTKKDAKPKPRGMLLHLMGSHFEYNDRYPPDLFPPEPASLGAEELVAERYARSEEYTAKILVELAALLDKVPYPAFLVYSSDHGENLPGDHNGLRAHLGPRASIHDGTTTTLFLWNHALMTTGRQKFLNALLTSDMLAHADVAKAFLALAGVEDEVILPTRDPEIMAPVRLGDRIEPHLCSALLP
jgi:glucan phosphoethanolaminetransferase (alkaline phosphatase superfamily)